MSKGKYRLERQPGDEEQEVLPPKPYRDPVYAADAPVNRKPTVTYADAMALRAKGELRKTVLTEKGHVCP